MSCTFRVYSLLILSTASGRPSSPRAPTSIGERSADRTIVNLASRRAIPAIGIGANSPDSERGLRPNWVRQPGSCTSTYPTNTASKRPRRHRQSPIAVKSRAGRMLSKADSRPRSATDGFAPPGSMLPRRGGPFGQPTKRSESLYRRTPAAVRPVRVQVSAQRCLPLRTISTGRCYGLIRLSKDPERKVAAWSNSLKSDKSLHQ